MVPQKLSTSTDEMPPSGSLQICGWNNGVRNGSVKKNAIRSPKKPNRIEFREFLLYNKNKLLQTMGFLDLPDCVKKVVTIGRIESANNPTIAKNAYPQS